MIHFCTYHFLYMSILVHPISVHFSMSKSYLLTAMLTLFHCVKNDVSVSNICVLRNCRQACAKRSHAGNVAPINVKFCTVKRTIGPLPVPNFMFIGAKLWEYSPKTVKISNFGHKFMHQRRLICNIFTTFSEFVRIYR